MVNFSKHNRTKIYTIRMTDKNYHFNLKGVIKMAKIKFLTGLKKDIDAKLEEKVLSGGSIILTSDTDEIVFINPLEEKRIIQSKTQSDYVLKGTGLGSLKEGDVIPAGFTIDDLMELLTKKVIPPTYKQPSLTIGCNLVEDKYEVGSSLSFQFQSNFVQNDAGNLVKHNFYQDDILLYEGGNNKLIAVENNNFIVPEEATIFKSLASYEAGKIKTNNFDEPDPEGAIEAGELTSKAFEFKGYRKLFYGTGSGELPELISDNIRNLNSILDPKKNLNFDFNLEVGQQYIIIAYPSYLGDIQEITYLQLNDSEMVSSFEKNMINVEGANGYSGIDYNVYTYKTSAPIAAKMTFKVTI